MTPTNIPSRSERIRFESGKAVRGAVSFTPSIFRVLEKWRRSDAGTNDRACVSGCVIPLILRHSARSRNGVGGSCARPGDSAHWSRRSSCLWADATAESGLSRGFFIFTGSGGRLTGLDQLSSLSTARRKPHERARHAPSGVPVGLFVPSPTGYSGTTRTAPTRSRVSEIKCR